MVLRDILTGNHYLTAQEARPSGTCLRMSLAIIWAIIAYDIWCCQYLTIDQEINPLAQAVMAYGGVWLLVSMKVLGTFVATEILRVVHAFFTVIVLQLMLVLLFFLVLA